jgi:hypothetical protein
VFVSERKNRNAADFASADNGHHRSCCEGSPMKSAVHASVEIKYAVGRCSLGAILVAASDKGVCAILLA